MIQETYDAILAQLPAASQSFFRLGRRHFATTFEAPRIIMAPDVETLTRGAPRQVNGRIEKPLATSSTNFVFWVQALTYAQTEALVNTLLTAIQKSGKQPSLEGVRIEWDDTQIDQSQGVTATLTNLSFEGVYLEAAAWAQIDTIIQECQLQEG